MLIRQAIWNSPEKNTMPTPSIQLLLTRRVNNSWPAGLTIVECLPSRILYSPKAVKHAWHILHDTTKNEVPPCRLKFRKPYNKEAQVMLSVIPGDWSKDAWIAATWKQEWEASGPTRVHRHVSDPGARRRHGRTSEPKTLDDSKQPANWGQSVQFKQPWRSGDWRRVRHMWVWRARTDSWPHHQQLPTASTSIRSWLLRSWAIDQSMASTDWVNDLIRWYTKEEVAQL